MQPRIISGATVTLAPLGDVEPTVDEAVLVRVRGSVYLHLVTAIRGGADSRQFQIGNNHGGINGWVSRAAIYGRVVRVENR